MFTSLIYSFMAPILKNHGSALSKPKHVYCLSVLQS